MSQILSIPNPSDLSCELLKLHITQGQQHGMSLNILSFPFVIGRGAGCHLRLIDNLVSRRHCVLELSDGKVFVRDLDSSNGTSVNSRRVSQRCNISPGDLILVGVTLIRLEVPLEAMSKAETIS